MSTIPAGQKDVHQNQKRRLRMRVLAKSKRDRTFIDCFPPDKRKPVSKVHKPEHGWEWVEAWMGPECWMEWSPSPSPYSFSVWLQAYSSVFSSRSPAHHKVIVLTRKVIPDIEKKLVQWFYMKFLCWVMAINIATSILLQAYKTIKNHFQVGLKYQNKNFFQNWSEIDCNFATVWVIMVSFF